MKFSSIIGLTTLCGLILGYNEVIASPMQYTTTEVGSGTFGGVAYSNALVTITLFGDTDNVTTSSTYIVNAGGYDLEAYLLTTSAAVSVAGIGTGTFLNPLMLQRQTYTWVRLDISGAILINDVTTGQLFWGVKDSATIATYAFGPVQLGSLTPPYAETIDEPTTFGDFVAPWPGLITSGAGTFEAVAVPEPSSALLLCSSVMFAAHFRLRRLGRHRL